MNNVGCLMVLLEGANVCTSHNWWVIIAKVVLMSFRASEKDLQCFKTIAALICHQTITLASTLIRMNAGAILSSTAGQRGEDNSTTLSSNACQV